MLLVVAKIGKSDVTKKASGESVVVAVVVCRVLTSLVDTDADDGESGGDRRVDGGATDGVLVIVVDGGTVVGRRVVVNNENVGRGDVVVVDGLVTGCLRRVVRMFDIVTSLSLIKLLLRSNQSSKFFV